MFWTPLLPPIAELLGVDQMWVRQGVSASDMDSIAHAYVAVPARTKPITMFLLPEFSPVVLLSGLGLRLGTRLPLAT